MLVNVQALRTAALSLTERGLLIIPLHSVRVHGEHHVCTCGAGPACRSPGKHPRTRNGLDDATRDHKIVERVWGQWPDSNIGIRTGIESRVLVLDFDDLQQLPEKLRQFVQDQDPGTWRVTTGRGGKHVFFRYDGEDGIQSRTGVWPKVDVRADRGYVVAPPSVHASGSRYVWDPGCCPMSLDRPALLPDWLEHELRRATGAPAIGLPAGDLPAPISVTATTFHQDQLDDLTRALRYIDPDPRDLWLRVGMAFKSTGAGEDAYRVWTAWSEQSHKFDEKVQRYTWDRLEESFRDAHEVTIASVFYMAKQAGMPPETIPVVQVPKLPPLDPEVAKELDPGQNAPDLTEATRLPPLPPAMWDRLRERSRLIWDIVQWISKSAVKPQPELALGNTLAAIGALLGRRVKTPGNVRSNLLVLGIGHSGAGKEWSRTCIVSLFRAADLGKWIGPSSWKSDSGLRAALVTHPCQLCQVDEFGQFMQQLASVRVPPHQLAIKTKLLDLFGRSGSFDDPPAYSDPTARQDLLEIVEPTLSVYATTTPGEFFGACGNKSVRDGFLTRWLCFISESMPEVLEYRERDSAPPESVLHDLMVLQHMTGTPHDPPARVPTGPLKDWPRPKAESPNARHHGEKTRTIDLTQDARQAVVRTNALVNARVVSLQEKQDPLHELWIRFAEITEKIALILATCRGVQRRQDGVVEWEWQQIDRQDIELARDLATWCFDRFARTSAANAAESDFERKLKRVLACILRAGSCGISGSLLYRRTQDLRPKERSEILEHLGAAGEIQLVEEKSERPQGGGNKRQVYRAMAWGPLK